MNRFISIFRTRIDKVSVKFYTLLTSHIKHQAMQIWKGKNWYSFAIDSSAVSKDIPARRIQIL